MGQHPPGVAQQVGFVTPKPFTDLLGTATGDRQQ
jgi:hypothetical protein